MPRFDPFKRVECRYGAPMGRHGDGLEQMPPEGRIYARHCGGDGYYDKGGAYWGHSRIYAVFTRGGEYCAYIEAFTKGEALRVAYAKRRELYD